eukprot:2876347-Amphidinium_carterae.1
MALGDAYLHMSSKGLLRLRPLLEGDFARHVLQTCEDEFEDEDIAHGCFKDSPNQTQHASADSAISESTALRGKARKMH